MMRRGFKFVSGRLTSSKLTLVREDGSTETVPVWLLKRPPGADAVDNGDGTVTITVP